MPLSPCRLLADLLLTLAAGSGGVWSQDAGEEGERLSSLAGIELHALADELAGNTDQADWATHFSAHFRGSLPRDEPSSTSRHGVYRIRRLVSPPAAAPGTSNPVEALEAWLSDLSEWEARRVAFKIVAVRPGSEDHFATEVLFEAAGQSGDQVSQWNARWLLEWIMEGPGSRPRIQELCVLQHRQVSGPGPLFVEVGGTLLDPTSGSTAVLALGCEDLVRRIDRVGEPNWFGHNGLALGDVNGDGLEDLYVATGTGVPNLLFMKRADGTLEERGDQAGVAWLDDTKGVLLVDMDGDGDKDLLCAMGPAIMLSTNDGEGNFTPANSLRAGSNAAFYSIAAGDYDLDGDLDLYAVRYVKTSYTDSVPIPFQDARNGPRNHLLRNDGGAFVDVTDEVGLGQGNDRFSLAATWVDYDSDGDPDLYVANDFGRNNLYRNDSGHFVDVAAAAGTEDQAAGMGAHWGDPDRDGDLDLLVSNMFSSAGQRVAYQPEFRVGQPSSVVEGVRRHSLGNSLFMNQGDGTFLERGDPAGLRMGRWSWGSRFVDLDCDGLEDVVVPNGFVTGEHSDDL